MTPEPDPAPDAAQADPATVAFPAPAYRLTGTQEQRLVDHAFDRLETLEKELGRDRVRNDDWWRMAGRSAFSTAIHESAQTWMGKRMAYTMTYEGEVGWRATALGGIFAKSNWLVPISRRVVTQQVARANGYLFGTEPWLAIDPQGARDADLARASDRWVKHKFREGGLRHALEAAVESAFIRGEAVVKHIHTRREDLYDAWMTVLLDPAATGEPTPKLGADGEVITPEDTWATGPDGATLVLARDGVTPRPAEEYIRWMEMSIPRRVTHYAGPETAEVYFKDFLCPLNAPTVQAADCVVHLYDETVANLVDRYARTGVAIDADDGARNEATRSAVAAFQKLAGNRGAHYGSTDTDVGAGSPWRPERPEDVAADANRPGRSGTPKPISRTAEFWLRYDANGDGILENLLLVVDRETRQPIYYNTVPNVTPTGLRPFSVVRINPVRGRWYGVGGMQVYEQIQAICDLQVNRWNFSQTRAGRLDFTRPYNTIEGQNNPNLELNWGGTYTPVEGKKAEDCIESVYLTDIKSQDLKQMLEFWLQLAMNMSGVSHANDLAMAGADSIKTATGTLNVEKMGYEQFGQLLSHLEEGVAAAAQASAEIALMHMDEQESYTFFEGATAVFDTISRADLSTVRLNVRLTLTRHRAEQQMTSGREAIAVAAEFYTLAPEVQMRLAPLYRQVLRGLQIDDAEEVIQPLGAPPNAVTFDPALAGGAAPFVQPSAAQGQPQASTADPGSAPFGPSTQQQGPRAGSDRYTAQMSGGQAGGLAAQAGG